MPPPLKAPAHHCAVCPKEIQRGYLMCVAHWRLVPQELQQKVYHTWSRAKRARGCSGYDASLRAEYATARREAIEVVTGKGGNTMSEWRSSNAESAYRCGYMQGRGAA